MRFFFRVLPLLVWASVCGQVVQEHRSVFGQVVRENQFEPAGKALARALSGAQRAVPWDRQLATLKEERDGTYRLLRFSRRGVEDLGRLEAPTTGLAYANVWAACGPSLVVMSRLEVYLYRGVELARSDPWDDAIAGAACDARRLFLFPRIPADERSPGREPVVKVVDLSTFEESVWRVSPPRASEDDPLPVYSEVKGALTRSGKLWTVGLYSGEVRLFNAQGKELMSIALPPEIMPAAAPPDQQAVDRALLEAKVRGDATKPQPSGTRTLVPNRKVAVDAVGAWGEELVVVAGGAEAPSVVLLSADEGPPRVFRLPPRFLHKPAAVSEDGVWFLDPPGYFPQEIFNLEATP